MNQGKELEEQRSSDNTGKTIRRLTSEQIFAGQKQVIIEHGCDNYTLRQTRQGKLILTK